MSLKMRTKLMFAKELENMLKSMPMDKVRVTELCRCCGTIPPTFYYHFHDKYELAAWIFLYDFTSVYGDIAPGFNVERIILNLQRMEERRKFYQRTYTDHSQNAINHYIQQFNVKSAVDAIHHISDDPITPDQMRWIKYHSYGMMGLFEEWLMEKDDITIQELASFQYNHTPEFLKDAYDQYPFSTASFLE